AARPLANNFFVARLLVGAELALRVSVKIGAFAIEDKQQQQFGIQTRRRHVIFDKKLIRGINGLFELHGKVKNLPQRALRTQRAFLNLNEMRDPYDLEDYRSRGTANLVSVK